MSGLKPFRHIPRDIREWTTWMREQDLVSVDDLTTSTEVTTAISETAGSTTSSVWTIKDFDGNYSLVSDDAGKFLRSTSGSATNVTVPSGVFQIGEQVVIEQQGAGTVTIVAGSGVTIRTPSTLVVNEQYGTVTLILMANDEWIIAGRMTP